jgi:hypothetical protein
MRKQICIILAALFMFPAVMAATPTAPESSEVEIKSHVFYVNNTVLAGGDGSPAKPFNDLELAWAEAILLDNVPVLIRVESTGSLYTIRQLHIPPRINFETLN